MNDLAELLLGVDGDSDCFDYQYELAMLDALDLGVWADEWEEEYAA